MKLSTALMGLVALAGSGCGHSFGKFHYGSGLKGSGKLLTEARKAAGFTKIRHEGVGEVTVTAGKAFSVKLTVDNNLAQYVKTTVDKDTLVIKNTKSINPTTLKLVITMPTTESYKVDGAGSVTISDLNSDSFVGTIDGAGALSLSGSAKNLKLNIDGAGAIDAFDLKSDSVRAVVDGTGSIQVNVKSTLDATINGAGSIQYKGSPKVTQKVDGIGSVEKA